MIDVISGGMKLNLLNPSAKYFPISQIAGGKATVSTAGTKVDFVA